MTTGTITSGCHRHRRVPFHEQMRFDATRSVDWRWQRAWWHVWDDRRFSPGRDDEATGRAVSFLRTWLGCRTKRQFSGLRRRDPVLFAAHALQQAHSRTRMEIEARLLAGQNVAEVANRTSLSLAVVEVFEKVFFDVQDSLAATGWIMAHAIGPKFFGRVDAEDFPVLVKGMAYVHGPVLLDAILGHVVDEQGRFSVAKVRDFYTAEGRCAARTALFLTPRIARQNGTLIAELERINDLIARIERSERSSPVADAKIGTLIDSLNVPNALATTVDEARRTTTDSDAADNGQDGQGRHVA